eukprot:1162014-Pelagomonas_calceolata.AAC.7
MTQHLYEETSSVYCLGANAAQRCMLQPMLPRCQCDPVYIAAYAARCTLQLIQPGAEWGTVSTM